MPKIKETVSIPKKELSALLRNKNSFTPPPQMILDEWYDNVEKANQVFFDLTPNTITVSDDGLGMEYDTFINDFLNHKEVQGATPNSTGVFGIGGSKGIPYLIGLPKSIAFTSRDGKSYYKGVWEYDGSMGTGMFGYSSIESASVKVYTMTKSEYLEEYKRECGYVPTFVFSCKRLGMYAGDWKGEKVFNLNKIKQQLSIKMMEGKSLADITVTSTTPKGRTSSEDLTPAYHPFVTTIDGKQIIAPNSLEQLPFEKETFLMGQHNAKLKLKCYKKSCFRTEDDSTNEKLIEAHRNNEPAMQGWTPNGDKAADAKPTVHIATKSGRILHSYIIDDTNRSSNTELMNYMVFVFYADTWEEQIPFDQVKSKGMGPHVYADFNEKIANWMKKPAQKARFTHGEDKEEDKETEKIRETIVYGTNSEANNARGLISTIMDCKPSYLKDKDIVRCQVSNSEPRALDLKIEGEIPLVGENKLKRVVIDDLDQAISMSYALNYEHHMVLLVGEITPHFRDNAAKHYNKRMNEDRLGKAVSFTIMTKTALYTGDDKSDTNFIELYRHEDYIV